MLDTWPLVLVRHAHAVSRGWWDGPDDRQRPLDRAGLQRAEHLSPVLGAYGLRRVVSSPSLRCVQTVSPYTDAAGLRLRTRRGLSEEGFEADPTRAVHHLEKALAAGRPVALCSHGPLLPTLVDLLAQHAADADPEHREALGGGDRRQARQGRGAGLPRRRRRAPGPGRRGRAPPRLSPPPSRATPQ